LIPGQGIAFGYQCDTGACVGLNENPSLMPVSQDEYVAWAKESLKYVIEQVNLIPVSARAPGFSVTATGLSFGGTLALLAAELPDTPIQKVLAINPHLSNSIGDLDYRILECKTTKDPQACIGELLIQATGPASPPSAGFDMQNVLATVVDASKNVTLKEFVSPILINKYDNFTLSAWDVMSTISDDPNLRKLWFMELKYGWGAACDATLTTKGGYCNFRFKHLFATHAFGHRVVGNLDRIPSSVPVSIMTTDVDGYARDALTAAIVNHFSARGNKSTRCRYPLVCTVSDYFSNNANNRCVVPHACLFRGDPTEPMYWIDNLHANMLQFITSNTIGSEVAEPSVDTCIASPASLRLLPEFDSIGTQFITRAKNRYFSKGL
jgi:hypothetical protein